MYKSGGYFSLLSSFCHLMMGLIVILQPVLFQDANVDLFLNTLNKNPTLFILFYLFMGLVAVFGFGVIEQATSFLNVNEYGIIKWSQKLAYVAFAVTALAYFKVLTVKPYMASVYAAAAEHEKGIILTMDPYISFSPNGIIIYGLLGVWILLINILSYRQQRCSKLCLITGIILGCVLILIANPMNPPLLSAILNTVRGILSFLWFGLIGIAMLKYNKKGYGGSRVHQVSETKNKEK